MVALVVLVAAVVGGGAWLLADRIDSDREPAEAEFDFSVDSLCGWFTAAEMDQIIDTAQQRAGTALELPPFAPQDGCRTDSVGPQPGGRESASWNSGSTTVWLVPGLDPPAEAWVGDVSGGGSSTAPEAFVAHPQLSEPITYGNLGTVGSNESRYPPRAMAVHLKVAGHEDPLWFSLEIWGPGSVAGSRDLDDSTLASLGLAVADGMLSDMNWVD